MHFHCPIYKRGKWGLESFSLYVKVMQSISGKTRSPTWAIKYQLIIRASTNSGPTMVQNGSKCFVPNSSYNPHNSMKKKKTWLSSPFYRWQFKIERVKKLTQINPASKEWDRFKSPAVWFLKVPTTGSSYRVRPCPSSKPHRINSPSVTWEQKPSPPWPQSRLQIPCLCSIHSVAAIPN